VVIHCVVDQGRQVHASIGVRGEVLDRTREDGGVSDDGLDVVGRVDHRAEQADGIDRAGHRAGRDGVAYVEGVKEHQERSGREVGEQSAPGDADGHTAGSEQRGERRRFHAEDPRMARPGCMSSSVSSGCANHEPTRAWSWEDRLTEANRPRTCDVSGTRGEQSKRHIATGWVLCAEA